MKPYAYILRGIAEHSSLPTVQQAALAPGVKAVFRVTMHYADMHISSAVATMIESNASDVSLKVVYQGRFENKPLTYSVDKENLRAFALILWQVQFDQLSDQQDVPMQNVDLCLLERGANGFVRGVIFSPQTADSPYTLLYAAVRRYIPQALREIK